MQRVPISLHDRTRQVKEKSCYCWSNYQSCGKGDYSQNTDRDPSVSVQCNLFGHIWIYIWICYVCCPLDRWRDLRGFSLIHFSERICVLEFEQGAVLGQSICSVHLNVLCQIEVRGICRECHDLNIFNLLKCWTLQLYYGSDHCHLWSVGEIINCEGNCGELSSVNCVEHVKKSKTTVSITQHVITQDNSVPIPPWCHYISIKDIKWSSAVIPTYTVTSLSQR